MVISIYVYHFVRRDTFDLVQLIPENRMTLR